MERGSRPQHVAKLPRTVVCGAALRVPMRWARVDAVDAEAGLGGRRGAIASRASSLTRRESNKPLLNIT